jgi:hypothetical protein
VVYLTISVLSDLPQRDYGPAWERITLHVNDDDNAILTGQGGPDSEWGRIHGANVYKSYRLKAAEAREAQGWRGMIPCK